jgi:hypothetical protein
MPDGRIGQFTDTMIRVDSLETAAEFLTGVMGMTEIEKSTDGIILEDPDSKQRITVVTRGFGGRYALALATGNISATLDKLRHSGTDTRPPQKAESGVEYAVCKGPSGIPIMVYATE